MTFVARVVITINGIPNRELVFTQPWIKNNPVYWHSILETAAVGTHVHTLAAYDTFDQSVADIYEEIPNTDLGDYFNVTQRGKIPADADCILRCYLANHV